MITKIKNLTSHSGFQRYFKNTSWLLVEKVIRLFLGLFIGIWVARYLGPTDFGTLNYVISLVGIVAVFGSFGLNGIVIRELVNHPSKRDRILGSAFLLKIIGTLLVLVLLSIITLFMSNSNEVNLYLFIVAFAGFFASSEVISFYFESRILAKYIVKVNIVGLILSSLLKIYFILMGKPLVCFIVLVVFDAFILMFGLFYVYIKQKLSVFTWKIDKNLVKNFIRNGWPLIISSVMITVYLKLDQVMIHEMLGADAVGQYAAAVRLSTAWYFVPAVVASSLFPALLNARKVEHSLFLNRLSIMYTIMIWLAIIIAIPMSFLSDWLIVLLFGNAYSEAGTVLMIHIWTAVFVFANMVNNNWYVAENQQKLSMLYTSFGAILNIIMNYFFITSYGIEGAAGATLLSYFIAVYLCLLCNSRTRPLFKVFTEAIYSFHHLKSHFNTLTGSDKK
ncbi:flippase [Sulfurovum sp. zt1-1]|uniref:Flippase n=1 Tax=Sulfurovum zhangzhouensis TaxID=3019067 RepID=A0ABT7R0C0_9BACT|nr:flippase [Sulfurovum zhangzhouensis]MDM5272552.1 flippase [Sulfurovum zhangzhouensis]